LGGDRKRKEAERGKNRKGGKESRTEPLEVGKRSTRRGQGFGERKEKKAGNLEGKKVRKEQDQEVVENSVGQEGGGDLKGERE